MIFFKNKSPQISHPFIWYNLASYLYKGDVGVRSKKKLGLIGLLIFGGQFLFHLIQKNFFIELLIVAILFLGLYFYGVLKEEIK